jgi:hypothetical protein
VRFPNWNATKCCLKGMNEVEHHAKTGRNDSAFAQKNAGFNTSSGYIAATLRE